MRTWHAILFTLLVSCGQQPSGTKTEYYIEDGDFSDTDTGTKPVKKDDTRRDDDATAKPGALTLTFKDPSAADAEGKVKIEVEIKNAETDATWSAYYSLKEDHSDPESIAEELPVSQASLEWDTSTLEAGTYYLFAELQNGTETKKFSGKNPVVIDETGSPTNGRPTLVLDFPQGENVFVAGTPQNIRWTSTDPDNDAISFKVEYSADGGSTWAMLADNVSEKQYSWDVTGLEQGITYKIKVTAKDVKGAENTATSTKNFGVATTPMTFAAGFGAMMTQRCGNCHAAGRPNAGQFRSDLYESAANNVDVSDKMMNIKNRIENNTMPPGGNALDATDKAVLTMWLWGGGM